MIGAIDWDFVVDILSRIFPERDVIGIIDVDSDGLEVLVGVEFFDIDDKRVVDVYRDEVTGNWVVICDGYKYYFRDFIDIIEFISKKFGGI